MINDKDLNFSQVTSVKLNGISFTHQDPNGVVWLGSGRELFRLTKTDLVNVRTIIPNFHLESAIQKITLQNNVRYVTQESSNCILALSTDYKTLDEICFPESDLVLDIAIHKGEVYALSKNVNNELSISLLEGNKYLKVINLPYKDVSKSKFLFYRDRILVLTFESLYLLDLNGNLLSCISFPERDINVYQEVGKNIACNGVDIFLSHPSLISLTKVETINDNLTIDTYQSMDNNTPSKITTDDKGNFVVNWLDTKGFVHFLSLIYRDNICFPAIVNVKDNSLYSIGSHDITNNILIGGYYGLRTLEIRKNVFNNYLLKKIESSSYLEDGFSMRGIVQVGNEVYFAREINNLYRLDLTTDIIDTIFIYNAAGKKVDLKVVNNLLYLKQENKLVFTTAIDNNTSDLVFYDLKTKKSSFISFEGRIASIAVDKDDNILAIGFYIGVNGKTIMLYDLKKRIRIKEEWKNNDVQNYVKFVDSLVFFGSKSGLEVYNKYKGLVPKELIRFAEKFDNMEVYFVDKVSKYIMVGTALKGLIVYDLEKKITMSIDDKYGLESNSVTTILQDLQRRIWVTTYNGLHVFDENFDLVEYYNSQDCINHEEFNRFSNFRSNDTLYFGGINGITQVLTSVDNGFNEFLDYSTGMVISYYDEVIKRELIEYSDAIPEEIIFFPDQSNRKLKFSEGYFSENRIEYRLKLLSVDVDWRYSDQQNYFTFPDIEVGKFKILLQRRIRGSQWKNLNIASTIFFQQNFVKSRLFLILIISGLVISLVLYFYNMYSRNLDYNNLREAIAADLHDELGSALTSISMQARLLSQNSTDEVIEDFIDENQKALQLVRDTIWSVNPDNDNVQSLVDRCTDITFRILNKLNIPYVIYCTLDEKKILQIDARKEIYLIFKEAITNVAKHSTPTETIISFKQDSSCFELKILNNGVNKKYSRNGLNMGVQNMKLRAEKINGNLEVELMDNYYKLTLKTPVLY